MGEPSEQAGPAEDRGSTPRERAYLRAYELVVAVQSGAAGAAEEIDALVEHARERRWPEVHRAALFAAAVSAKVAGHGDPVAALGRFLAQAEEDRAPAMVALALAMRASQGPNAGDPQLALTAEEDLARAVVILESADGPILERISAHNSCAQALCERWLWELCDDQYAAALKLAPSPLPSWAKLVLPAIVYNRAEMQVNWACILRQLGDLAALEERWHTWQTVMLAAPDVGMPPTWALELDALCTLLGAIAGRDTTESARAQLASLREGDHPGAWPTGWLHLAAGLSAQGARDRDTARREVELAVSLIDPVASADAYDLALFAGAELAEPSSEGATMRYARRQLGLRWSHRLAVLGATVGRIQAERLRREHDLITQQAHLDDLTALLNRRGLARYLESLVHQGVDSVALIVADVDHFKTVNDRYGHSIGDTVLVSLGRLLHAHVRQSDCAVRLGGDEFAIVLASAPADVARRRAEAVLEAARRQRWSDLAPGLAVTVSVGLASGTAGDLAELTERADRALYEAKRRGRDRLVVDSSFSPLRITLAAGDRPAVPAQPGDGSSGLADDPFTPDPFTADPSVGEPPIAEPDDEAFAN